MTSHHTPCTCHHGAASAEAVASGVTSLGAPDKLLPDTATVRSAEAYLAIVSNETMIRHCKRSYRFGVALADKAGAKPDLEALYIGCLFHDLGLETRFAGPDDFETLGAREARRYLISRGEHPLAEQVAAAIELHTSVETARDPRPEVAYLHIGAVCDVFGARLDQIEPRLIQQVVAEYPRDGTKTLLTTLLKTQIDSKPQSRIARIAARSDVLKLIQDAPFPD